MLMHRIMTLGHIVATTSIPWRKALGIHKKKKFNADALLAKRGIAMMKEWQNSYQVSSNSIYLEKHRTHNICSNSFPIRKTNTIIFCLFSQLTMVFILRWKVLSKTF